MRKGFWDSAGEEGSLLIESRVTNNRRRKQFPFPKSPIAVADQEILINLRFFSAQKNWATAFTYHRIYGGEILRQASLRLCPNGFSPNSRRKVVTCEKCNNLSNLQ